jgi:hypothetical protein
VGDLLAGRHFVMGAHNNLMAVNIDVALHEGHWLGEDIEAGTHQINVEHLMVAHNAENAFVVVASALRAEVDHDALR